MQLATSRDSRYILFYALESDREKQRRLGETVLPYPFSTRRTFSLSDKTPCGF